MLAKFEIYHDGEYWCARGLGADVFTQGKTYEELLKNIKEAALLHFEDETGGAGGGSPLPGVTGGVPLQLFLKDAEF